MKIRWKTLILCIAIPLLVGGVAGFISKDSMAVFAALKQPPLSPPGWLFPIVWTLLYTGMGIASYLVLTSGAAGRDIAKGMTLYGVQLFFNFMWTIWFFSLGWYWFSFFWLAALWLLIFATILAFYPSSKLAAYLLMPYFAWVAFAGYLNFAFAMLN